MLNNNKMKTYYILIALALLISACSNKTNYKKEDANQGLRIVSLIPSISKELELLDMGDHIVGATSYCDITKDKKDLIVGSVIEVNEEKIILLKPDMVFASGLTKQTTIETLQKNGITVHKIKKAQSFNEICDHFVELGRLVYKEELALSIANNTKAKIDSLKTSIPEDHDNLHVFFQIGAKPLYTVIPNTFMDDYITFSKCKNIASDLNKGSITRESVLLKDPDIIFIVTMGIVGDEEVEIWKRYKDINAVKNNKIFIIPSDKACTPTLTSFVETLETIIDLVYM